MLSIDANVWVAAFDPADRFHGTSADFLRATAAKGVALHGPEFVVLEVACALSRRAGNATVGDWARSHLHAHPALLLHPIDARCLSTAHEIGSRHLLRGADALYAATAHLHEAPLISWDDELVQRFGAETPTTWLTDNA